MSNGVGVFITKNYALKLLTVINRSTLSKTEKLFLRITAANQKAEIVSMGDKKIRIRGRTEFRS